MEWEDRQQRDLDSFHREGAKGNFSYEGHPGAKILRGVIEKYCKGKCLDIGCGLLPRPSYMSKGIQWVGIDPYTEVIERDFEFHVGIAEAPPFGNVFDSAIFATTLDHCISPEKAIREAIRVAKRYLIIWQSFHGIEDELHAHHFTAESLIALVGLELTERVDINKNESILVFKI